MSTLVHGKGDKDRTIPLHEDIAAQILAAGPGWLFPTPRSDGHLTPNYVGVVITQALPRGWSAHSLRRRFATSTYDASHLRAVQLLLGHTSLATTQVYIGSRAEGLRAALVSVA